jgi:hypothetical protein
VNTWQRLTDSRKSLPPVHCWLLVAVQREGGVVVEAYFDGTAFRMRDGRSIYLGGLNSAFAWQSLPAYPKELEP